MKVEQMRAHMLAAKANDWLLIREGTVQRRYRVDEVTGPEQSRQLYLRGVNGAERWLVDAVDSIMLVRTLRDGKTEGRRVSEVLQEAVLEPPIVVSDGTGLYDFVTGEKLSERKPQRISAMELAKLIRCTTASQVVAWVIDRMSGEAIYGNEFADETMRAMQVFVASRERLPEIER